MRNGWRTIHLAIIWLVFLVAAAQAMRCDGALVHTGDLMFEVLAKCGEPQWRERWEDEVFERRFFDTLERRTIVVEEWLYDFGPHRLLHILQFRNGRLVNITTGSRAGTLATDSCRAGATLSIGDTKLEVLRKCGAPAYSDSRVDEELEILRPDFARRSILRIDEWTYNFGPSRFLLHLTFENGRLRRMERGGYGF